MNDLHNIAGAMTLFGGHRGGSGLPRRYSSPSLTYALLAVNVAVFAATRLGVAPNTGRTILNYGYLYGPHVAGGEYWRMVTCMFLHADTLHILFNMYCLYVLGSDVELMYGRTRFGVIYLLAGVTGSAFSLIWTAAPSVGASGAIFGVAGAVVAFAVANKGELSQEVYSSWLRGIIPFIAINLYLGFSIDMIDNYAHIGGLVGGLALGLGLAPGFHLKRNLHWYQIVATIAAIVAIGGITVYSVIVVKSGV